MTGDFQGVAAAKRTSVPAVRSPGVEGAGLQPFDPLAATFTPARILALQRTAGNQAVTRFLARSAAGSVRSKASPDSRRPPIARRTSVEDFSTVGRDVGPVWDVKLTIDGAPSQEDNEMYQDFLDACFSGIEQGAAQLGDGRSAAGRTMRVTMAFRAAFDYVAVQTEAAEKARASVLPKPAKSQPKASPSAPAATHVVFDEPQEIVGEIPRTGPVPIEKTSGLTKRHRSLRNRARMPADPMEHFGELEAAKMVAERLKDGKSKSLSDYKDRWVRAHRKIITTAAVENDVPDWLLAGVAWAEVGGEPQWTDDLSTIKAELTGGDPTMASYGPIAMQVRRAAEELGYDPKTLSRIQEHLIVASLRDPQQNVLIVAAHLKRLKNVDSPAKPAVDLTDEEIKMIGARYNRGAELSQNAVLNKGQKTQYGDDIVKKKERLKGLLMQDK